MFRLIMRLLGMGADLFYRRRHLKGAVPADGPVVLVANHPNSLVDPVLVARVAGRPLRFLGKAPLFEMPAIGALVRAVGTLPVYRAVDGADTDRNRTTFAAVTRALAAGDAICVFPEGISHNQPALQPLKTGAARMALGAEAVHDFDLDVRIVPVGLVYRDKATFRSAAATQVGEPIRVRGFASAYRDDERAAVRSLTRAIDDGLREVTVNLERWEDLPLLEIAEQIWHPGDGSREERLATLADGTRTLRRSLPTRMQRLARWIASFEQRLELVGLELDDLDRRFSFGRLARFVGRNLVALLVGLPVALAGGLAYAAPYWGVQLAARLARPERDVTATVKLLASLLIYPVWHSAGVTLLTWKLGWPVALPVGVGLPFAGLYAAHFVERREAAWRELRLLLRFGSQRGARQCLARERDAIAEEIDALAAEL